MRISTSTIYDNNVAAINQQQARLQQTQLQVATGHRLSTPSVDPAAAAQAIEVSQADAANTQYASNRSMLKSTLSMMDTTLMSVTSVMQDIRTSMLDAGSSSLTNANRQSIATSLTSRLQQLIGLANSTDGTGNYLFSGFQSRTPPFVDTVAGVAYFGDDGQKLTQISASRQLGVTQSGADIFMRMKNGNGTFVTQAAATNTGSGISSQGNVVNPALLTGNNYNITFSVAGPVTTFSVTNTTTGLPVAGMTAQPYTSGQAISFDGMQFDIQGAPANGDQFTVTPSTNVSIFKTVSDFINALNTPITPGNVAQTAAMTASFKTAINNIDHAFDNVNNANAVVGSALNEIDAAQLTGDNLGLQYKQTLSQLQDTDYAKGASDIAQQLLSLQAAQKSFVQVSNLSLFTYM